MTIKERALSRQWHASLIAITVTVLTFLGFRAPAGTQLLSARNPSIARPAGGNGDSVAPYISSNGDFVLFLSTANDLTLTGNNQLRTDLYLRNRLLGSTSLVSPSTTGLGGGNGDSYIGMVSTNGRYVVFASDASDLVPNDTNSATDIFLRDLQAGTTTLISVSTNGTVGNGSSTAPFMSPDGRFIAFVSTATNLIADDTNGTPDVFVRDTLLSTTTLASPGVTGPNTRGVTVAGSPVITPDGRYVAFFGYLPGLPTNSNPSIVGEIYRCDLTASSITWASSNVASLYSYASATSSTHPVISVDGRFITFKYGSTNGFNPSVGNGGASFIVQYDALFDISTVVNSNAYPPVPYYNDIYGPEMTPDGRYIVFAKETVVSNTPYPSIHIWDRSDGVDSLVSQDQLGGFQPATISDSPVITADGHFVAFMSTATNLVSNNISAGSHVYVRDLQSGITRLADVDTNGLGSVDCIGTAPSISTSGQYVAFSAPDGSFVAGDSNHVRDVFLRDLTNNATQLLSVRNPLVNDRSGGGLSTFGRYPSFAQTGRWVVYQSRAEDLVTNDFNGAQDVFEADLVTGSNTLVSVGLDGNSAQGGDSQAFSVSADGRHVVFLSAATNLVNTPMLFGHFSLFRRDMQAGTTVALNVDTNGNAIGVNDVVPYEMSPDGRLISFLCPTNFNNGGYSCLWNASTGTTTILATNIQLPQVGTYFSDDGRYVLYDVPNNPVSPFTETGYVWDTVLGKIINTNILGPLSPTGTHSLGSTVRLQTFDFKSNVTIFPLITVLGQYPGLGSSSGTVQPPSMWSTDGRFLAGWFRNAVSTPAATDTNLTMDVYLEDLVASNLTLLSTNLTGHSANAQSDSAAISRDGRFVVFRSWATDVAPGITNVPNTIVYDRFTGSNSVVTSEPAGNNWFPFTTKPVLSGNGSVLAFQSLRSALVPGVQVLNHQLNVYSQTIPIWGTGSTVGDGIPDSWRAHYFGGDGTTTNAQSCATCDADGDGSSNLQEFLAGTDPTNPSSALLVHFASSITPNGVVLQWSAVPGINYVIQYSDSLTTPNWTTAPGGPAIVGFQASYTAPSTSASRYYRVVVVPPSS